MILTYHGASCVRAQAGDTTIVFGPVSKQSKNFKPTNFGADVVCVSLNHPDMNGAEDVRGRPRKDGIEDAVHGAGKQPFVISGPGEYEVQGMTITGFGSTSKWGGSADAKAMAGKGERTNTIYAVLFDGLSVVYFGAHGSSDIPKEILEMNEPDVLIIPIGGSGVLTPAEAQKVSVNLEARIVIPILYDEKSLKQFLKEAGAEGTKPEEKLTLKPKDVVGKENEVVVLGV